jgi:hypothetical protein
MPFINTVIREFTNRKINSRNYRGGNNDSGLFQLNFQDAEYLPFEGAGAESRWRFKLPQKLRSFDYSTISDLILHLAYTAKDGGATFEGNVNDSLVDSITSMALASGNNRLNRAFSMKSDFPIKWHRFLNPEGTEGHAMTLDLTKERFPLMFSDYQIDIDRIDVLFMTNAADPGLPITHGSVSGRTNLLAAGISGVLQGTVYFDPTADPLENLTGTTGEWVIETPAIDKDTVTDLVIILHYGISK